MKYLQFFGLVTLISALTFAGCSKDDEKPLLDNEFYPTNFNLLKVTDGAGDVDLNPVLEWQESKDPNDEGIYYDVYLDKNQQPTTKIKSDLASPTYTVVDKLEPNTKYYWKVVARNMQRKSTESGVASFTTKLPIIDTRLIGEWRWEEVDGKTLTTCGKQSTHDFKNDGTLKITTFPNEEIKCPISGYVTNYTFEIISENMLKITESEDDSAIWSYDIFTITGRGSFLILSNEEDNKSIKFAIRRGE